MHRPGNISRLLRFIRQGLLVTLAIASGHAGIAQEETPYTLHVYTNLVQVPTLVLGSHQEALPLLTKNQFTLTLDSGPPFHPTEVHLQGEDPILLAILLDASGNEQELMATAADAIASLANHSLTSRDHVVLFAFDCEAAASPRILTADQTQLRNAVDELLRNPALHGSKHPKAGATGCYYERRVWDALAIVVNQAVRFPGRRAVIAITHGSDEHSKIQWKNIEDFAISDSISLFGVYDPYSDRSQQDVRDRQASENILQILTGGTGGLILSSSPNKLPATLQHVVELLRNRYIIEFPRPQNNTSGAHIVDVKVPQKNAIVRAAGVAVPLATEKELNNPDNVPSDPTRAPTLGKRKPLKK